MALPPLNVLSFCAGVGGLELGIRIAEPRARGVAYLEREAAAAASLVASMEAGWFHPAPVWSDAGTFDARPWRGRVHIVASGDPCQPNSVAGKRQGDADDRWLIDQLLRVVAECRPDRLFRENVPGNLDGQLAALVPPLEAMGYHVACGIFSAAEVGASHRRERFFLMADREGGGFGERGEAPQPGRVGHADGRDAGFRRADVADAYGGHACAERQQCGGKQRFLPAGDGIGGAVADACDGQFSQPGRGPEARDGAGSAGAGFRHSRWPLDDALCGRHEHPDEAIWTGRDGPLLAGRSGQAALADAELRGQQDKPGLAAQGRESYLGHGGREELPAFAPGPADPRWPGIIARAPQLEPAVRRMAYGLAYRIERLRAVGNGVCPLAAADAYLSLDAALAADRAARARAALVRLAA